MQSFSLWPERGMRLVRWTLLIGWGLLIASLFWPVVGLNSNFSFKFTNFYQSI